VENLKPGVNIEKTSDVSILEVRQLLTLLSQTPNIGFRFRQTGEMWMRNHMRVVRVSATSVLLYDEQEIRFCFVKIENIIQFDLDNRIHNYQPHFHYSVLRETVSL
jgi:hypothetical protein